MSIGCLAGPIEGNSVDEPDLECKKLVCHLPIRIKSINMKSETIKALKDLFDTLPSRRYRSVFSSCLLYCARANGCFIGSFVSAFSWSNCRRTADGSTSWGSNIWRRFS